MTTTATKNGGFAVTAKTTKAQLEQVLNANFHAVQSADKALADTISYAGQHKDKAKRSDLVNLVKSVMKLLGDKFVVPVQETFETMQPVAENSVKKSAKKEKPVETPVKNKVEETPKKSDKTTGNKKKTKSDSDKALSSVKTLQMAVQFPETLEYDGGTYTLAHDIKTLADLEKATNEADEEIMIACFWSKRLLKQFPYFNGWVGQPTSFPNDLDITQVMFCGEKVAYSVSDYTEAVYSFLPDDFEEFDGIRASAGMEYQIYRKTGEVETEEPEETEEE